MLLKDKIAELRQKGMDIWNIKDVIYRFNYNEDGLTPLMLAVISNNPYVVDIISSCYESTICGIPVSVNIVDKERKTALDYAYEYTQNTKCQENPNSQEIIKILQHSGACRACDLPHFLDSYSAFRFH